MFDEKEIYEEFIKNYVSRGNFLKTELGKELVKSLNTDENLRSMRDFADLNKPPLIGICEEVNRIFDKYNNVNKGDKQATGMLIATFMRLMGYKPKGDNFKKSVKAYTNYFRMAATFEKD